MGTTSTSDGMRDWSTVRVEPADPHCFCSGLSLPSDRKTVMPDVVVGISSRWSIVKQVILSSFTCPFLVDFASMPIVMAKVSTGSPSAMSLMPMPTKTLVFFQS
jgi:hypothetical protein